MNKYATKKQIAELDRLAIEEFGLDILQMMEIAGNQFAVAVQKLFSNLVHKHIMVLAGTGNNGGDGLCAARHLANWGAQVKVILAKADLKPAAKHQLGILRKMGVDIANTPVKLVYADLIVDALLGYNQIGNPHFPYSDLINQANRLGAPVFAFDNPSGLNIDNGKPQAPTIKAHTTITLAALKRGLASHNAKTYVGNLHLVDIGIPKQAYQKVAIDYPFSKMESG